jgi:hypothetical protein
MFNSTTFDVIIYRYVSAKDVKIGGYVAVAGWWSTDEDKRWPTLFPWFESYDKSKVSLVAKCHARMLPLTSAFF